MFLSSIQASRAESQRHVCQFRVPSPLWIDFDPTWNQSEPEEEHSICYRGKQAAPLKVVSSLTQLLFTIFLVEIKERGNDGFLWDFTSLLVIYVDILLSAKESRVWGY